MEKTIVYLKYIGPIMCMTGKKAEVLETRSETIDELVSELDQKYSGLKKLFFDSETRLFNVRTVITLRRIGEPPVDLFDPKSKIQNRDLLVLW